MTDYKSNEDPTPKVSQKEIADSEQTPPQDSPPLTEAGKEAMQGPKHKYVPMPDKIRMDLYEIEKLPPDQRGSAFGEYFKNSPESVKKFLSEDNGTTRGQRTEIFDSVTGKPIIVRDDKKQIDQKDPKDEKTD